MSGAKLIDADQMVALIGDSQFTLDQIRRAIKTLGFDPNVHWQTWELFVNALSATWDEDYGKKGEQ